ncbi:hypothetical protein HY495_01610 [Candidatus Woesearchaeota archaeon]|nr:hypothetical protein [Candidatus Woesearchaeota archaeon]
MVIQKREVKREVKLMLMVVLMLAFLLVAGCFNYKQGTEQLSEKDILKEIAKIEQEVSAAPEVSASAAEVKMADVPGTDKAAEENKTVEEVVPLSPPEAIGTEALAEEMQLIKVKENEQIRLIAQVRDPDNDTIQFTFSEPLNEKGEWKTSYGDAGEYLTTFTVTDGALTTIKKIKLVVERVNVAPVIEPVQDITVDEGKEVTFAPTIKDPNNDKVSVVVSEPLNAGVFKTDHTSAGEYTINVEANDGELTAKKTFKLTVKDVNVPPEIGSVEDLLVKEGDLVTIKPAVTDIDGDNVKVTVSSPVGDDGVWQTGYTDHGEYVITITADDGKAKVTRQVKLTVSDVNMPPEIVKISLQK